MQPFDDEEARVPDSEGIEAVAAAVARQQDAADEV
jgi:hypothetical protein